MELADFMKNEWLIFIVHVGKYAIQRILWLQTPVVGSWSCVLMFLRGVQEILPTRSGVFRWKMDGMDHNKQQVEIDVMRSATHPQTNHNS